MNRESPAYWPYVLLLAGTLLLVGIPAVAL
jgi:hypothetical protein